MDWSALLSSDLFSWVIVPLLIFFARVCDVSLGTLRIIFISRGIRYLAPVIGFFEVLIWLLAIGQIFQHLTNALYYVAYAGGFASGTFVGMYIEGKLSIGTVIMRIITKHDASRLIEFLKAQGYGVTIVDAQGMEKPVKLIFTTIRRRDIGRVREAVKLYNPTAFYTIEDIRFAAEGMFPPHEEWYQRPYRDLIRVRRKGK
ncbi:MAG TPA: DUF2179 domain-containing protein [Thermoplasmatales archaeon]|nr:DUF2179 domain-containing protein [Candidatus Thermoplasmatota archaeon]MDD5778897.1 DUF2179 domain-containing protein [Candidatus Thermoplasmatota archaeon]HDS59426.1 DUF2179 domain-containing protein [Thermoplasmatales archaeon]